ncbi:hypothetical protein GJ496_010129 [Pomphorhynchus laevis]|nr:hypothetical protein GJ496_010129 [Pomphorhynchus laevis]
MALARVLRDFYSYAERKNKVQAHEFEYQRCTHVKLSKLQKLGIKKLSTTDLNMLPLKRLRRFNKPIANSRTTDCSNIVSLIDTPLNSTTARALSLGLNFVPFEREFPRYELISKLKEAALCCMKQIKDKNEIDTLTDLFNKKIIRPYLNMHPNSYCGRNVNRVSKKAIQDLSINQDIVVCKADKGVQLVKAKLHLSIQRYLPIHAIWIISA